MFPATTYTATCRRDGTEWLVHVPELGRSLRTARLTQVEGAARSLVATCREEGAPACRVVVELDVRHGLSELLGAASAARQNPDRVSVEAVTLRRGLARRLAAEGLDVRDVAALLGLSYGRALQLVGEGHAPRTAAPLTLPPPRLAVHAEGAAGPTPSTSAPHAPPAPAPGLNDRSGMRPHRTYRHEAYLYRGLQSFLDSTVPFVAEGAALGQPVMVAVAAERLTPLRTALAGQAADVYWVDMRELGANPARIIPAWRQFVDAHGGEGRPVRGVGEPIWPGRQPAALAEAQLHEALLNLAVEPDTPLWLRCPYDAAALPPEVLEEAARSHPALVDGEDYQGSRSYGGADHACTTLGRGLPEPDPEVEVEELVFDLGTLDLVRQMVLSRAGEVDLGHGRSSDLVLAVWEASSNSVRHGGGQGRLRVWQQDGALVCEVTDSGAIDDPLAGRRLPSAETGRGLWLVNQLVELVQLRSGAGGTTVRMITQL